MNQFIDIKKGLKEDHLSASPLFEKIYTPPGYGNDMISRLYNDGSLYYLVSTPGSSNNSEHDSSWGYVSSIDNEGVMKIVDLLKQCCEIDFNEKAPGNLPGLVKWKFLCYDTIKQVDVKGIPDGDEKLFNKIDYLVSTHITKV
ncbi:MAG: hypothetical protein JXR61_06490 [Prolixibacteraceae bacterium]|nr:hypothetical protein [Prolixibacteraceae bacterium]